MRPGRPGGVERQQHRQQAEADHGRPENRRLRRIRRRDLAGDDQRQSPTTGRCDTEQRGGLKALCPGPHHNQHPHQTRRHGGPAPDPHDLPQQRDRQHRDQQRRQETDGRRLRHRHFPDAVDKQHRTAGDTQAAKDLGFQVTRVERPPRGARGDHGRHGEKQCVADPRDLNDRQAGAQEFCCYIRDREHRTSGGS